MTIYEDTNSTYDLELKLAIPTYEYIKSMIGYNVEILGDSNTSETKQRIKGLTSDAKDELYTRIPLRIDKDVMDYLIATEKTWRNDFIKYAVKYINETFSNPDFEVLPKKLENAINGSLLSARKFSDGLRHEVKDLEW